MLKGFVRGLLMSVISVFLFVLCICILIVVQGSRDEQRQSAAAIVLGASQWNGEPSPVFRARLNHAMDLYRRGLVGKIILTGGTAEGDTISEAEAGRRYLVAQNLPNEVLLLDEQSTTTWENLQNAAEIARNNGINSVLLVSDPFHMLRSLKMARDLHLVAYGSPTRTSPISGNRLEELRYIAREAGAYLIYVLAQR
jgi:uncharacterized SAM-binding protein YcdF (DUF218 family)